MPIQTRHPTDQILRIHFLIHPNISHIIFQVIGFVIQLVAQLVDVLVGKVEDLWVLDWVLGAWLVKGCKLAEDRAGVDCVLGG
jgi:hypothetical protein